MKISLIKENFYEIRKKVNNSKMATFIFITYFQVKDKKQAFTSAATVETIAIIMSEGNKVRLVSCKEQKDNLYKFTCINKGRGYSRNWDNLNGIILAHVNPYVACFSKAIVINKTQIRHDIIVHLQQSRPTIGQGA